MRTNAILIGLIVGVFAELGFGLGHQIDRQTSAFTQWVRGPEPPRDIELYRSTYDFSRVTVGQITSQSIYDAFRTHRTSLMQLDDAGGYHCCIFKDGKFQRY